MTERLRIGCYPGSFDPPTVAHLAVAEAAIEVGQLHRVELVISRDPLGKEAVATVEMNRRLQVLHDVAKSRPWLEISISDHRLIVDVSAGYDAVIMGADKWRQVNDPAWYGDSTVDRDAALARLPHVLVAPRSEDELTDLASPVRPSGAQITVTVIDIARSNRPVSSSAIRAGELRATAWTLSRRSWP